MARSNGEPTAGILKKFKHKLFTRFIQNKVATELQTTHGLSREDARHQIDDVDDDMISHAAVVAGVAPPTGPIIDWISNLDPEKVAKIIQTILLLLGFL